VAGRSFSATLSARRLARWQTFTKSLVLSSRLSIPASFRSSFVVAITHHPFSIFSVAGSSRPSLTFPVHRDKHSLRVPTQHLRHLAHLVKLSNVQPDLPRKELRVTRFKSRLSDYASFQPPSRAAQGYSTSRNFRRGGPGFIAHATLEQKAQGASQLAKVTRNSYISSSGVGRSQNYLQTLI
jgi:hypothetical protein